MRRVALAFAWAWIFVLYAATANAQVYASNATDEAQLTESLRQWLVAHDAIAKPAPCSLHCFLLSTMSLKGAVGETLLFELHGSVLVDEEIRVPLFGSPSQVRLDDVTINGAPATLGFENDAYYVLTRARAFVLRGKMTLTEDQTLHVSGPINALDVKLTSGRLTEGSQLSGVENAMLHFDPMTPQSLAKAKTVFRLSRALRIGKEKTFIYRLSMSGGEELGTVRIPLSYGEHVREVAGASDWSAETMSIVLPLTGHDADVTISGTIDHVSTLRTDERSAYEWWMVEAEPDTLLTFGGDVKLVDMAQSPIPPSLPSARLFLLQRGQHLDLETQPLVQGDSLSAVVRDERHFFAFTPLGEVIHDGTYVYDNSGLERLFLTPSGKPMFVSVDGAPSRILRTNADKNDFLVQLPMGQHRFRVQTLSSEKIRWFGGVLSPELPSHKLATSRSSVTLGLPENVLPIALFGGDKTRTLFALCDLIALGIGCAAAGLGFRNRRTRVLGAVVISGLWLVSHSVFVVAAATLFCIGGIFVASRFLSGLKLVVVGGACVVVALVGAKISISIATAEYARDVFVADGTPTEETSYMPPRDGPDGKLAIVPVQLSIPRSDTFVGTQRQLVGPERPFRPRLVYVTAATLSLIELAWVGLCGWLLALHRALIAGWIARIVERLRHRPEPSAPAPRPF
jgi:hypothetical protein